LVLQGQELVLEPGDCVSVPKGAVHSAEVVGNEPVISLDALRIA
jgi:mannose-6-phosphate isomerase-like protein (cupin superfamily)